VSVGFIGVVGFISDYCISTQRMQRAMGQRSEIRNQKTGDRRQETENSSQYAVDSRQEKVK